MSFKYLLAIALALSWPVRSMAAESGGLVVTLASVADRVRTQNPDLAAARLRIGEALGRMKQSGRRENPRLETEVEHNTKSSEGSVKIGFTQSFPVTDRLRFEKEISVQELKAAEAEVRDVERKLVAEGREELVKILAIRRQRELLREQADVSKKLAEFIDKAAEKGEGSRLDAGQAKLEAAKLATEIRQLDAAEVAATGALKPLLGMSPSATVLPSGELPPIRVPEAGAGSSRRPDMQVARVEAEAVAMEVNLEQTKKYDDIEVGVFGTAGRRMDAPDGVSSEGMVGFQLSIPLPLWNDNSGNVEAAQAKLKRKQLEITALDRNIRNEAEAARAEMEQWAKLEREVRAELLPLADRQAELAEQTWRNGQGELQVVLKAREQRLQLASSRLDALRDFHLARVRYEAAINQR
ncbi:TolC family protein [Luteolibacter sp. LG18]|uniref:TolC family protein n=1 Tax=Luteolibacter sp. LG18 TaxID=2819286 RepID=UPI002B31125B|nr:cellobiose phosphorylase [Luteolibacter sp. LG18]